MINRTIVRTRVIQTLFAYYQSSETSIVRAGKALSRSFSDTYSLYITLLAFVNELTDYAQTQLAENASRARAIHVSYTPNRRFVENRFAQQLYLNRTLRHYIEEEQINWEAGQTTISNIYRQLVEQPFFKDYMSAPESSYEADKTVWRKIFGELLPNNEELQSGLEELEISLDKQNWTVDVDVVLSYIVKTIKRFQEDKGADQELLPMFDNMEETEFAQRLLEESINHHDESIQLIHSHLKNWDADRIAFMDTIILQVALAEIMCFPDIAVEISLNEYIELAKEYSGDKSYLFVNGILNEILLELKRENRLLKPIGKNNKS